MQGRRERRYAGLSARPRTQQRAGWRASDALVHFLDGPNAQGPCGDTADRARRRHRPPDGRRHPPRARLHQAGAARAGDRLATAERQAARPGARRGGRDHPARARERARRAVVRHCDLARPSRGRRRGTDQKRARPSSTRRSRSRHARPATRSSFRTQSSNSARRFAVVRARADGSEAPCRERRGRRAGEAARPDRGRPGRPSRRSPGDSTSSRTVSSALSPRSSRARRRSTEEIDALSDRIDARSRAHGTRRHPALLGGGSLARPDGDPALAAQVETLAGRLEELRETTASRADTARSKPLRSAVDSLTEQVAQSAGTAALEELRSTGGAVRQAANRCGTRRPG